VSARARGADTIHDARFFPAYLAGIAARRVEEAIPARRAGTHFAIAGEGSASGMADLDRAVREGRARVAAEFPRRADGTGGAVRVYEIPP
jgi:hypothetical protein